MRTAALVASGFLAPFIAWRMARWLRGTLVKLFRGRLLGAALWINVPFLAWCFRPGSEASGVYVIVYVWWMLWHVIAAACMSLTAGVAVARQDLERLQRGVARFDKPERVAAAMVWFNTATDDEVRNAALIAFTTMIRFRTPPEIGTPAAVVVAYEAARGSVAARAAVDEADRYVAAARNLEVEFRAHLDGLRRQLAVFRETDVDLD